MKLRMLALPLIAVATVGLSACSSQNPGNPQATGTTSSASEPTSTSTASGGTSLASVAPCSLITQAQVTNNGLQAGQTVDAAGGRACRWVRPDDGTTVDGYNIEVVIYDTAGVNQLNTAGGTVTDYSVGKYQGKLFEWSAAHECIASVATSSNSRVDVSVVSSLGSTQGCTLVQQVAPKVVANFPA